MTSPQMTIRHSRSIQAGYRPELLFKARAVVVGLGALGQNLAQDLALAGVGQLDLIDFDRFEDHNSTRSPLFPTAEEQARWGDAKAAVAAHKLRRMTTAPDPIVRYAVTPVQALGDALFAQASLVFSAVDSAAARAYLAERCRIQGKPLFEGGFHGPEMNLAVFGTDAEEPCYRCQHPEKTGAFSCRRYALQAEAAGIIPGIQNTAAVLGGLQAEAGIQWLHDNTPLRDKRAFVDLRTPAVRVVLLSRDRDCPGVHWQAPLAEQPLPVDGASTLAELLEAVRQVVGEADVRLPEPLVVRNYCTTCGALTDALSPEWRWLADPRCTACGGPFPLATSGSSPTSADRLTAPLEPVVAVLPCATAGLPSGSTIEVWPADGERLLVRLSGEVHDLLHVAQLP